MPGTLKIAIPMAGFGTRLRPHTWSKPKPLVPLAGKTVLDHVLDQFATLPDPSAAEYVFIVGPGQQEQIQAYIEQRHPELAAHYVVQESMRGQSDALLQARDYLTGPMLMVFSDTLVDADFAVLKDYPREAIAWVKEVDDPRRYGVAQVDGAGTVTRLVEKPKTVVDKLAVVGFYYFPSGEQLVGAIEEQVRTDRSLNNEFFLADAINIMLEGGLPMRSLEVNVWLDAGMTTSLLETNRYLLAHGHDNSAEAARRESVTIIPPVYIDPDARVTRSVIGPHVSIAAGCEVEDALIRDSILDQRAMVCSLALEGTLLGRDARAQGRLMRLNLGDNAWLEME